MKKQILLLSSALLVSVSLFAQCPLSNMQYPMDVVPCSMMPNAVAVIAPDNGFGEFSKVQIFGSAPFRVENQGGGYITVFDDLPMPSVIAHGLSPLYFTAPSAGIYQIQWSGDASCNSFWPEFVYQTSIMVTNGAAAIEENGLEVLTVFPNPTHGVVTISNEGIIEDLNYSVLDIEGRVISSKENAMDGMEKFQLDLSNQLDGIYYIRIFSENAEKVLKVVLQK